MEMEAGRQSDGRAHFTRSGAVAGVVSTLVFTVVHDILISDIWFSAVFMLVAGALCGTCIGWSYAQLVERVSLGTWLGYNLLYVAMLMLLGVASVVIFEPVTSMAALMAANGPPDALIRQALPMTFLFTLLAAVAITLPFRRSLRNFGIVLLTTAVLVLLLGLNVSALGLVSIPRGSLFLVAEFLGLIVFINVVYVGMFMLLEGRALLHSPRVRSLEESV